VYAFLKDGESYKEIPAPGENNTVGVWPQYLNNAGQIAGWYAPSDWEWHWYLFDSKNLDAEPVEIVSQKDDAPYVSVAGITGSGQVFGTFLGYVVDSATNQWSLKYYYFLMYPDGDTYKYKTYGPLADDSATNVAVAGVDYAGRLVVTYETYDAQVDPYTGQPILDPYTGQPVVSTIPTYHAVLYSDSGIEEILPWDGAVVRIKRVTSSRYIFGNGDVGASDGFLKDETGYARIALPDLPDYPDAHTVPMVWAVSDSGGVVFGDGIGSFLLKGVEPVPVQ